MAVKIFNELFPGANVRVSKPDARDTFNALLGSSSLTPAHVRTHLGLGTMALQAASAVAITGGALAGATINNSPIGGTTPAAGAFTTIGASGNVTLSGGALVVQNSLIAVGTFDGNGASNGSTFPLNSSGWMFSRTGTTGVYVIQGHNANGLRGNVTMNATGMTFNTASDELFKRFFRQYAAAEAIRIIRADPVREWEWLRKNAETGEMEPTGDYAVGWGAQTSYKVSEDLATPGGWIDPETGEPWDEGEVRWIDPLTGEPWDEGAVRWVHPQTGEGLKDGLPFKDADKNTVAPLRVEARRIEAQYMLWGTDQGRRTPYLWTAVAWLLDERDEMKKENRQLSKLVKELVGRVEALESGARKPG